MEPPRRAGACLRAARLVEDSADLTPPGSLPMLTVMRLRFSKIVATALAAALVVPATAAPPPPAAKDVLLITIDTARADRFSYIAPGGPGTPRIDALAREGVGFTGAITPVPLTKPAHASLMTGRLPPSHSVRDNGSYRLPDSETTLAEVLRSAGYATAAFVGAQVLDARYGFNQGFQTYDDRMPASGDAAFLNYAERRGEDVAAAALRWLEGARSAKVFVWVHLFDPHAPYRPPEPERSRFASGYDGEIAYVDRVVGMLLDRWKALRGLDRLLVVVTADHGEALGEHDEATHGVLVHDATIRVPLVIRCPGLRLDKPVAAPVSLIDVFPTILGLLELPRPAGVEGRDLTPLLRGGTVVWSRRSGYVESLYAQIHHGCTPLVGLRENGFKLVRGAADALYALSGDPKELVDAAGAQPERARAMGTALDALLADLREGSAEAAPLDDRARRALESLGYSWSPPAQADAGKPRDPREALRSMKAMADADRRALSGDVAGASEGYRRVIADEPGSVDARVRLAQILLTAGRNAEAAKLLAAAVAIAPKEPELYRRYGDALAAAGRFDDALSAYDSGLALHPAGHEVRDARWHLIQSLDRHDQLLAEAERAIAADPSDGTARQARALACCGRGPVERYIAALEKELAQLPGDPTLLAALAQARAEKR